MSGSELRLAAVPLLLLFGAACAKTIGGSSAGLSTRYIMPDVMASGDLGVGCASGEALGGLIGSFRTYSGKAARASVLPQLSAGMCLDGAVHEAELDAARAYFDGDVAGNKDARIRAQRAHLVAARRYAEAFARVEAFYGVPDEGEGCPKLKGDFEELGYLLGLSSGVLAVLHDMSTGGEAGVDMSIPAFVVRGAKCLDDDRWWGVPMAMQASVWALMPDAPGAGDPWATFDASFAKGQDARVRLAGAFLVQTASTVGHDEALRDGIARFAAAQAEVEGDPAWLMLDRYATDLVLHESDKLWVAAVGHRTPFAELGTFPSDDEPEPLPDLDLGDLFED